MTVSIERNHKYLSIVRRKVQRENLISFKVFELFTISREFKRKTQFCVFRKPTNFICRKKVVPEMFVIRTSSSLWGRQVKCLFLYISYEKKSLGVITSDFHSQTDQKKKNKKQIQMTDGRGTDIYGPSYTYTARGSQRKVSCLWSLVPD